MIVSLDLVAVPVMLAAFFVNVNAVLRMQRQGVGVARRMWAGLGAGCCIASAWLHVVVVLSGGV